MKTSSKYFRSVLIVCLCLFNAYSFAQHPEVGKLKQLMYHQIRTDSTGGILPWYSDDPGTGYTFVLNAVWRYWKNIPGHWVRNVTDKEKYPDWKKELPFPPKYLMYRTLDDVGVGGDQFAMMLSSFNLYYDFTGNQEVLDNMIFQANWYLKYGLSGSGDVWPDIPYPCNTTEAPIYDGDLILGKGFTQPDKAGSFGAELIMIYKKTGDRQYLEAALKIANTLSNHTIPGDYDHSPLPFKVQAVSGEIKTNYCTNWVGTMQLFEGLIKLKKGNTDSYKKAYDLINKWMLQYPVQNNRWGPFFEDISTWSDTEINEGTFARYMLTHTELYPDWRSSVRHMQDWAINKLGIPFWKQYGCMVMGEQSIYKVQGQSHTSRHASIELLYAAKTLDNSKKEEAKRQLNFCTYAVDNDGKCRWMNFDTYEIWWTDGYGDFIRHYIRSMDAAPELAPSFEDHILSSSSVIQKVYYSGNTYSAPWSTTNFKHGKTAKVYYKTFDKQGIEKIRLARKPFKILINGKIMKELRNSTSEGYSWKPLSGKGGLLTIIRIDGEKVIII